MLDDTFTVYLVRHAIAAERSAEFPDDRDRPLTHQGITRFRREVRGLASLDEKIDRILTSPLVRARQTAEILGGVFPKATVVEIEALAPGGSYRALMSALGALGECHRVALVGHEPDIGETAARMIGARGPMEFKKGAICCIEFGSLPPAGPGALRWFVPPRVFRAIKA